MATGIPVSVGELIDTATINTWARGYLRKNTAKTVNTSPLGTWVDLLNGEFTLPAGAMGTDKIMRLTAWGDWKQGAGSPKDLPAFRLGLGATTLIDTGNTGTNAYTSSSTRHGWRIVCEVQNLGSASSQWATFSGRMTNNEMSAGVDQSIVFTTGEGCLIATTTGIIIYDGSNTGAVDTSASCALTLKVNCAVSSANYEVKLYGALCEII